MLEEDNNTTEIVNAVNTALDTLLLENKPRVCFCCDHLLTGEQKQRWYKIDSLQEMKTHFAVDNLLPELLKDYTYVD
jgi:hypothetical protein